MSSHVSQSDAATPTHIAICGKGRIATAALSFIVHYVALEGLSCQVVACANRDDKGYDTWQESLTRAAGLLGVDLVATDTLERIPGLLLVSLEYDWIIPVRRFASRRLYNIHFSALPAYRGVFTAIWPILNREESGGVTLHVMDAGVDTGDVIAQPQFPIGRSVTARQLHHRCLDEGLELFREWMPRLLHGCPPAVPQDPAFATTYDRRSIDLRAIELPFQRDADDVCAFVRAYTFPEYQRPTVRGRAVRSCTRMPIETTRPAGSCLHDSPYSTTFATGRGGVVEVIWA